MEFWLSLISCIFQAVLFVLSLYLVDSGLSRNHPVTVRRRVRATIAVCILSFLLVYLLLLQSDGISLSQYMNVLGFRTAGLLAGTVTPCLLVLMLYTGYLVQTICDQSWNRNLVWSRRDLMARDYVVAPFAEEFIFRGCMLAVLCSAMEKYRAIFVPPVLFGLAHLHHLMEWYRGKLAVPLSHACLGVILQMTYTSIFGLFTSFVFVRSRHLVGVILAHSLCNLFGLPPVEEALQSPWKKTIILCYLSGVVLFCWNLFILTDPALFN